jgi:hypothetical protein
MSPFELFFSLFGLILGLAIATVIGGLGDVLRERNRIRLGTLTPMLAIFVLIDLSSVWVNAWSGLSDIKVDYGPFVAASIVAAIYFFAASMVFPKVSTDWETLDDYYITHYRWVIGGVMAANFGLIVIQATVDGAWASIAGAFVGTPVAAIWWTTLLCLWLFRQKRVQMIGLGLLQVIWIYVLFSAWAFA